MKTVEVKVEPTSSKSGESLNTSAASTSSNDGKWVQSIEIHVSPEICAVCLDVDLDVFIYFSDKDDDGDPLNILREKDVTPVGEYLQVFMYNVFRELHDVLVR